MQDGLFGFLDTASVIPISGLSELIEPLNPSAVSVATSLALAAARTAAGVVLVRSTTGVSVLDARPNLISPSVDPYNYIWSVPASAPSELLVFSTDGKATPLSTPWPNASSIVSLNISRDGTRLIALMSENGRSRFVAASIQRGDRNFPVAIGTPVDLAVGSGTPLDAAWVDPSTVVSLVQGADGSSLLVSQAIGGQSADLPAGVPVVSLAGANVITQLRTRGADGSLYALRGSTYWQLIAGKVSALATMQ
jgi:hypothetical protein